MFKKLKAKIAKLLPDFSETFEVQIRERSEDECKSLGPGHRFYWSVHQKFYPWNMINNGSAATGDEARAYAEEAIAYYKAHPPRELVRITYTTK